MFSPPRGMDQTKKKWKIAKESTVCLFNHSRVIETTVCLITARTDRPWSLCRWFSVITATHILHSLWEGTLCEYSRPHIKYLCNSKEFLCCCFYQTIKIISKTETDVLFLGGLRITFDVLLYTHKEETVW